MLSLPLIIGSICAYLGLLVAIGWLAERRGRGWRPWTSGLFYGLSLATLCSSWTYFGAVGDAGAGIWMYLANVLGPILSITLGFPIWRRIAALSKRENVGSLADFLAARYGKSSALGVLVALVATIGALPYIALQLIALARAWNFATGSGQPAAWQVLVLVALLMTFAVVFGVQRPSLTQQNRGLVAMVAFESCVKLAGLACVAGLGLWLLSGNPGGIARGVATIPPLLPQMNFPFVTATLLCVFTTLTLPRQFHLAFVTLEREKDVRVASWLVPAYFSLWALAVLAISLALRGGFNVAGVDPDMLVLALPIAHQSQAIAVIAILGGLSAGAAMVVVETTAVAAMVSNAIVLPLMASAQARAGASARVGRSILRVRRLTTVAIGLLAWLYYVGLRDALGPTQLGITALAASAQLLPALLGGLYWRQGHARGAIAGILAGMLVWAVAIAAPAFGAHAAPVPAVDGIPQYPGNAASLAIVASLALNLACYILVSLRTAPRLIDTIQATTFVARAPGAGQSDPHGLGATVADLRGLLTQFLGEEQAGRALRDLRLEVPDAEFADASPVSPALARAAERMLAGVIGAPSARNVVAIALAAGNQDAAEVSRILDEAAHAVQFGRELLQTTLESLDQGVYVVDAEMRLVAWNARYLELMRLPREAVHVGKPLRELFAIVADRVDTGAIRHYAERRLAAVEGRERFEEEVALEQDRTLRIIGTPLGAGRYLTTFTDITGLKQAERVLAASNEELEQRVQARTAELVDVNAALASAKQVAERATGAQQRFVAAASHDLVQPLHAARLFLGNALAGVRGDPQVASLVQRADQAVEGAHRLLRALLHLSQLEIGALKPKLEPVDAGELLMALHEEFEGQARARGIELVVMPTHRWGRSDPDLLRSMLQNLLVNAIRYTPSGRVVLACRPAGSDIRFEVRDSGVGIAPEALPVAFAEYSRLDEGKALSEGAGLGLAIVARVSQVLGHTLAVRSQPGRGSTFAILVPSTAALASRPVLEDVPPQLGGLRVLCVDDDPDVLLSTTALIERWGGRVTGAATADAVSAQGRWDVAIADYHLGGEDGLALLRRLAGRAGLRLLLTATPDPGWSSAPAELNGIVVLNKPIAPLVLQAVLIEAAVKAQGDDAPSTASATS
ncbi:PAS-domain containing protein [Sphingomonas sp. HITSZ_GF]|uniref:hybrid sensor histidine kinase/response regulator n=1 Tax=Sphingomonas sp. HITSZ_GF TaxID=3037247 RepID=UPI00240DA618|nr:PAS-domain containing protein [Sphingomonas sp. HITSZ_GF]MDG2533012.1 PAS-domain containing protein [Sphingomonas sp. HITSZ_GF]